MQGLLTNAGGRVVQPRAATRFREALRLAPVGPNDQRTRSQGEGGWNAPDELIVAGFNVFSLPSSRSIARALSDEDNLCIKQFEHPVWVFSLSEYISDTF